ncbi:TPA: hypothetical protein DIC38_02020 [Candidatus Nomurabacteria bacterium]|nr:MAG: hypothetical protein O210_OD1C00001G0328 [Parcubacteria bacterium RAAC4_OD1_1]HCY26433.1 hypothetical protein [Candidatus Nomurabacteria bacterium]
MGKTVQFEDPNLEVSLDLTKQVKKYGHCRCNDHIEEIQANAEDFKKIVKQIAKEKGISMKEAFEFATPYYQAIIGSDFDEIKIRI